MDFERFQFASRRSNVVAKYGMVATSQPLAAQAGLQVLMRGGNAVDAAIATVATLCVVEPTSTGVGGDAFALVWMAREGKLFGLNASGPSPSRLTADWVRGQGYQSMPQRGPISVTVPGSLRGWQLALERFGTWGLDSLLAQPIAYARDGFPVSERIARSWANSQELMSAHPDSMRVWLPGGRAPGAATLFQNGEFALSLQRIADEGYEAFYQGDIARQISACVRDAGGLLAEEDLASYRAEWVEPIGVEFRPGFVFHEIPPNGQGIAALMALNIASGFDLKSLGHGTADYMHALIESMKLAYVDAHAYVADPRKAPVPVHGLLSNAYAGNRRELISFERATYPTAGSPPSAGDTVYLTVADGEGNMVSWIQSLYDGFGSGLTAGTTGIQLQNRGANFSLEEGHPNEVGPGKRPFHTIIPGFITRNGSAWCSFGVMGGFMQPQGHLQVGANLVEFGMDPQAALDAPRFRWLRGLEVALESQLPADVQADLARRGHRLADKRSGTSFGGGQIIVRDPDSGVLIGGSEPRKDGSAVGW